MRAITAVALILPVTMSACAGADATPEFTTRVENGVTIAENAGVHVADTLAWSIDTTDAVTIGVVDGPDEYMIGRLAGMTRLGDGNILIADATAHELRVFDDSGRFVRKVGREGQGPGEYGWLTHILDYAGDSIVVMDGEGSRATFLDPQLNYVRRARPRLLETRAKPPMTSHRLVGFFDDGQPLLSDYLNVCGPSRRDGFCEDSVAFFRTNDSGATTARFGRFVYSRGESRPGTGGAPNIGWSEPHPQAMWVVKGDRFYYADAKRFEILVHRSDGTLERAIRVAGDAPRYEHAEVYKPPSAPPGDADPRSELASRAFRDAFASAALPDSFPRFSDLIVDAAGNIWVREYMPSAYWGERPPRWLVFDLDGRLRWSLRAPPSMLRAWRPYVHLGPVIGEDYILAPARDRDGVETVVRYRIVKRGPGG